LEALNVADRRGGCVREGELRGKRYLVTGGSRGIGRAVVQCLAQAGAEVAFTYRSGAEAANALCAETQAVGVPADVRSFEQARAAIEQARQRLGGLDGLVTNAGITQDRSLVLMSEDEWDDVIATNLKGTFNYIRAALYGLIQQRSGRIVCVSSVSGLTGVPGQTNYAATKAGIVGMVRSLSKEVGRFGVRVNAVAPGYVATDMWAAIPETRRKGLVATIPAGRPGRAEEVAAAVRFLLSPEADYISGAVLVIDGGLSA
jgi:3-oxoacyl-[acyl-carrier protein] reductase